jgi:hypothetical protein
MANYVLGRGKVYFDRFAPGTRDKTGERYFGNTPEITYNTESEVLDHFNSDSGIRQKDDQAILEITRTLSFIGDDISAENLALFFLADVTEHSQSVVTGLETTYETVKSGHYYQVGASTANPTGARDITAVVVKSFDEITTYVVTTDYTVDAALGRIYVVPGGAIALAEEDGIHITCNTPARTREQIVTADNTQIEGALRYVSDNPKGTQRDLYLPYVQLRPNGDFALKGEEWLQLPFIGEVLKLDDDTAAAYIDGRAVA